MWTCFSGVSQALIPRGGLKRSGQYPEPTGWANDANTVVFLSLYDTLLTILVILASKITNRTTENYSSLTHVVKLKWLKIVRDRPAPFLTNFETPVIPTPRHINPFRKETF